MTALPRRLVLAATLAACLSLEAIPALADGGRAVTDGLALPDRSISTQQSASSIEVNPAGIGFLDRAEFQYALEMGGLDGARPTDRHGAFGAAGTDRIAAGLAAQWLDWPDDGGAPFQKYSLAAAFRPSDALSAGLGVHLFGSHHDRKLDSRVSLDLGLQARPTDALAFGLSLADVNRPFTGPGRSLPLRLQPALGLRLFDGLATAEASGSWPVRRRDFSVTPRVSVDPTEGLEFFTRMRAAIRPGGPGTRDSRIESVTAGARLQFGALGVANALAFGVGGDGSTSTSHAVDLTPARRPTLVHAGQRWVRIEAGAALSGSASPGPPSSPHGGYVQLLHELRRADRADRIDGVLLATGGVDLGWGRAWELRRRLRQLGEADVTTVCLMSDPDFEALYVAAAADAAWTTPSTPMSMAGLHTTHRTYTAALRSAGIETEFLRIGEYKSSPERFVRDRPSPESIEQTDALLDALYRQITRGIAQGRGLERAAVTDAVDETPMSPPAALDAGFVDAVVYPNEASSELREAYGATRIVDATARPTDSHRPDDWPVHTEIAVLDVEGPIVQGRTPTVPFLGDLATGSEAIGQTLDALVRDPGVRAIVVRVNSPGGSAVASDAIFRALRRAARHKPVVASMGNVAASGGYYVAAAADTIFATPNTTTGSIGIFAGKFSLRRLSSRLGVEQWHTQRGERAGLWSLDRSWTKGQRRAVAEEIEYLYGLFLEQVSQTRPLDPREIDSHGRGRVWIGSDAAEHRLIDRTGGLVDAVRYAARRAGVDPSRAVPVVYPQPGFVAELAGSARSALPGELRGDGPRSEASPSQRLVEYLADRVGRRAWLPLAYGTGEPLMLPLHPLPTRTAAE